MNLRRPIVPIPADKSKWELTFPTDKAPSPPLEWTLRFADSGAVCRFIERWCCRAKILMSHL